MKSQVSPFGPEGHQTREFADEDWLGNNLRARLSLSSHVSFLPSAECELLMASGNIGTGVSGFPGAGHTLPGLTMPLSQSRTAAAV